MALLTKRHSIRITRQDLGGRKGNVLRRLKAKIWQERRRRQIFKKRKLWQERRHRQIFEKRKSKKKFQDKWLMQIDLPKHLDFGENYETTMERFHRVRKAVLDKKKLKRLDFSKIRDISPSAALALASEVDCWNQAVGGRLRADTESWHPDIQRLLAQMGYFELLDLPQPLERPKEGNTIFTQFYRGGTEIADKGPKGAITKKLRKDIEAIVGRKMQNYTLLFAGLSEAITNVGHHAYRNPKKKPYVDEPWWLSASWNKKTRRLCVTFYDHGVGIPETLPKNPIFKRWLDRNRESNDSRKIAAAMKAKRTSTYQSGRGYGLQDLAPFAKAFTDGQLRIYSRRGKFQMVWKGGNSNEESSNNLTESEKEFKNSIGGTLIEWSVVLSYEN